MFLLWGLVFLCTVSGSFLRSWMKNLTSDLELTPGWISVVALALTELLNRVITSRGKCCHKLILQSLQKHTNHSVRPVTLFRPPSPAGANTPAPVHLKTVTRSSSPRSFKLSFLLFSCGKSEILCCLGLCIPYFIILCNCSPCTHIAFEQPPCFLCATLSFTEDMNSLFLWVTCCEKEEFAELTAALFHPMAYSTRTED